MTGGDLDLLCYLFYFWFPSLIVEIIRRKLELGNT